MADQKLTQLDAATTLADDDLVYVVDDVAGTPGSKKLTGANLKTAVGGAEASGQYAVNTVAASGATETLPATHPAHDVTMDEDCTFTFGAPTAGHTFLLKLSGAFTPTFPAEVVWDGGTAPTYASPSVYGFTTLDGGTTWYGSLVGSAFA